MLANGQTDYPRVFYAYLNNSKKRLSITLSRIFENAGRTETGKISRQIELAVGAYLAPDRESPLSHAASMKECMNS